MRTLAAYLLSIICLFTENIYADTQLNSYFFSREQNKIVLLYHTNSENSIKYQLITRNNSVFFEISSSFWDYFKSEMRINLIFVLWMKRFPSEMMKLLCIWWYEAFNTWTILESLPCIWLLCPESNRLNYIQWEISIILRFLRLYICFQLFTQINWITEYKTTTTLAPTLASTTTNTSCGEEEQKKNVNKQERTCFCRKQWMGYGKNPLKCCENRHIKQVSSVLYHNQNQINVNPSKYVGIYCR